MSPVEYNCTRGYLLACENKKCQWHQPGSNWLDFPDEVGYDEDDLDDCVSTTNNLGGKAGKRFYMIRCGKDWKIAKDINLQWVQKQRSVNIKKNLVKRNDR